ncbi:MAG: hypothetical protein WAW88_17400 [Nocardioides sp.]|mgnify:CR=1 FL=1
MGMSLLQFVLSLVIPAAVTVLALGLVIVVVMKLAIRDGIHLQRDETEEEFLERMRKQIEDDRAQTPEEPPAD